MSNSTWRQVRVHLATAIALPALALGACDASPAGTQAARLGPVEREPVHIDSILPIEEELRRFRATVDEAPPESLGGEWTTREALVRSFVDRLEAADTAALRTMLITRAEFAYLYYPQTVFAAPPYELPPALVWFQMQNRSSSRLTRLLREFAGHELRYRSRSCDPEPEVQGE